MLLLHSPWGHRDFSGQVAKICSRICSKKHIDRYLAADSIFNLTMLKIWKYFFSQWGSLSNWWLLHSFVKAINRRHGRGYGVMAWVMWLLSWPWSLPIPWLWFLWPKELLLDDWYAIWFVTTYNTPFTWAREVKAIVWTFFCKTCNNALQLDRGETTFPFSQESMTSTLVAQ